MLKGQPTFDSVVATYLSTGHRDNPASGCPLAAIGSELSRGDARTREAATEGFERFVAILAGKSGAEDARRRALMAASMMIGAVTMSRIVTDAELSAEILSEVEKGLTTE